MTPSGEFSHKVTVDPWPEDGISLDLTASEAEREALRARFDLVELRSLHAVGTIEKKAVELVLAGRIEAEVAQSCVVTLQPVLAILDVPFERHYRRPEAQAKMTAAGDAASLDDERIDIDTLEGDEIDVGEAIAEEFYLALDPYPRAADADRTLEEMKAASGMGTDDGSTNPFEQLRRH